MNTIVRIFAVLLTGALVALSPAPSHADEPAGDLLAFAVQGNDDCSTPGYVHINHARGVTWSIDGKHVDVEAPSSEFSYPGGLQGDVTAEALPGYSIPANVQSTFYVTIYPCPTSGEPEPPEQRVPAARVNRLEAKVDRKDARIASLRDKVDRLRHRLHNR